MVRVYEKLMGLPHQKQNAAMVRDAVHGLKEDVNAISKRLREYQESDDPLVAMMLDVFNSRESIRHNETMIKNSEATDDDELR